jgi:hypothetical protein
MKNDRAERAKRREIGWLAALLLGVVVALGPSTAWAEEVGRCARAELPWAVTLPDGSTHDAGSLTLCLQQLWTPVSGLHEIRVNGHATGLFMSRLGRAEGPIEKTPVMVFAHPITSDEYRLVGYAWPDGDVMRTYTLRRSGKVPTTVAKRARLPLLDRPDADTVQVAALVQ